MPKFEREPEQLGSTKKLFYMQLRVCSPKFGGYEKGMVIHMKKSVILIIVLMFSMVFMMSGCNKFSQEDSFLPTEDTAPSSSEKSKVSTAKTRDIEKSRVAALPPEYIPISEAGTFDRNIITEELLNKNSSLPDASVDNIPYWTGMVLDARASANFVAYAHAYDPVSDGSQYVYKDYVRFLSQNGFNCMRMLYSLSFLSDPGNPNQVNLSELKYLDEIISWGMKYDVHIMISILGLPGKYDESLPYEQRGHWPNDGLLKEDVGCNPELFENEATAELYSDYMVMLSRRYAEIPSKNLSFELLAEPVVPEGDVDLYVKTLAPVVERMKAENPEIILIVNDVFKNIPEGLAELGCALSLHTHIYSVNGRRFTDDFGYDYKGKWPMQYLPNDFTEDTNDLILLSESTFNAGQLKVVYQYTEKFTMSLYADGEKILPVSDTSIPESDMVRVCVFELPDGVKELRLKPNAWGMLAVIELAQNDKDTVQLVTHDMYAIVSELEPMPTIQINSDGSVTSLTGEMIDSDYIYNKILENWVETAKKYNVGFLMTEIGTDTEDLSLAAYEEYHNVWLKALKDNQIPWMYNCYENILAPKERIWPPNIMDESNIQAFEDTNFFINESVIDILKKWTK